MALTQVVGGLIAPSTTLTTPIVATTMGVGGATASASGSGITFPATQSASSDANTLDDYEEGTWTPILVGSTSNPTYSLSGRSGIYTKVGRQVSVNFHLNVNTISGGSGWLGMGGLPFTNADTTWTTITLGYSSTGGSSPPNICMINAGDTKMAFWIAGTQIQCGGSVTSMDYYISGTYQTT